MSTKLNPYLGFRDNAKAAMEFYHSVFGGDLTLSTFGEFHASEDPAEQDKIMHGSVTVGEQVLMGADIAPGRYEEPKGFSLSLQMKSTSDAERIFLDLSRDGEIVMPIEKTFWAARFGVLVDRFGVRWLINGEGSDEPADA